ncbi:MAG: GNAT family N-acetyltransferase [Planctomycetota bacterium]
MKREGGPVRCVAYRPGFRGAVIELWNRVFAGYRNFRPIDLAWWRRRVESPGGGEGLEPELLRVAVVGERVVGLAHGGVWQGEFLERLRPDLRAERLGYLAAIAVDPLMRRRGIGSALLESLSGVLEGRFGAPRIVADGRGYNPFYGNLHAPLPPPWGTPEGPAIPQEEVGTRAFFRGLGFREEATAWTFALSPGEALPLSVDPGIAETVEEQDYQPLLGTAEGISFPVRNRSRTWVAVRGELQRGALIAYPLSAPGARPERWGIYSLEVDEASRAHGLGRLLLGALLGRLRERGVAELEVLVLPYESPAALRLYQRAGFRKAAAWVVPA